MHVRALRGVGVVFRRFFGHLHLKTYGQTFRRIASGIVAGLVTENSAHLILPRHD